MSVKFIVEKYGVLDVHKFRFSIITNCTPDSSHVAIRFVDVANKSKGNGVCGWIMGFPLQTTPMVNGFMDVIFKFLGRKN